MSAIKDGVWTAFYIFWLAAILWVSLDPSPPQIAETGLLAWDKFQHAAAYAVMTILGGLGLCRWIRSPRRCWLVSGGIAVVIGVGVEIAQGMMSIGRFADWQDALANTVGVASALLLVVLVRSFRSSQGERR
jgi:VanZ family protein